MNKQMNDMIDLAKFSGKQQQLYPQLVESLIRERYTISQELAIHRQRDTKPSEFAEYNTFCEDCKALAKEMLGI